MVNLLKCINCNAHDAGGDSGHMIRGSTMIDKIIGIRRLAWRVQPPKHWRKNKKPRCGDGFDKFLEEAEHGENSDDLDAYA